MSLAPLLHPTPPGFHAATPFCVHQQLSSIRAYLGSIGVDVRNMLTFCEGHDTVRWAAGAAGRAAAATHWRPACTGHAHTHAFGALLHSASCMRRLIRAALLPSAACGHHAPQGRCRATNIGVQHRRCPPCCALPSRTASCSRTAAPQRTATHWPTRCCLRPYPSCEPPGGSGRRLLLSCVWVGAVGATRWAGRKVGAWPCVCGPQASALNISRAGLPRAAATTERSRACLRRALATPTACLCGSTVGGWLARCMACMRQHCRLRLGRPPTSP